MGDLCKFKRALYSRGVVCRVLRVSHQFISEFDSHRSEPGLAIGITRSCCVLNQLDFSNEWQIPIALRVIDTIADNKLIRDLEAYPSNFNLNFPP